MCFNNTLQYSLLWWAVKEFWRYWVSILVVIIGNILLKSVVVYKIITKQMKWEGWKRERPGEFLLCRGWFHHYDLYMLIVRLATGFVVALVRFIMTIVIALITLTRANVSPLPAWVERYALLDTGSKSFQATLKVNHLFNNPIFRVACWLLVEDSAHRRACTAGKKDVGSYLASVDQLCGKFKLFEEEAHTVETKKNDDPDTAAQTQNKADVAEDTRVTVRPRRRSGLGVLRWRLAIMLHHYPQLRFYRAHYLARAGGKKPHSWKQGARDPTAVATPNTDLSPLRIVETPAEGSMAELAHRLLQESRTEVVQLLMY